MKKSISVRTFMAILLVLSTFAMPNASSSAHVREPLAPMPVPIDQSCDQGATIGASANIPGYRGDVNVDLGDYGVIFQDAAQTSNSAAWGYARAALIRKINGTMTGGSDYNNVVGKNYGPYQGWLHGANVSLIMISGLLLADHGMLNRELDEAIRRVIGSYVFNLDIGCGLSGGKWKGPNNRMDDYAVAATGFAWIAAYKYKRGDSDIAYYADSAKNCINLALGLNESVCAHKVATTSWASSDSRGPCNATAADLRAGLAEVISLNHGQQTIAYGLGLMTSISSAFIGLQTANATVNWSADQKTIALELVKEAQKHTDAFGTSFNLSDCYWINDNGTTASFITGANCGDVGGGYKPKMFPIKNFYTQILNLALPASGYQFDQFDYWLFNDGFFNKGRQVIYGDLTKCWYPVTSRPALGGPPVAPPLSSVAWIKPSYASWGPANTLTIAGYARNGSGGVQVMWRDVTAGGTNGAFQSVAFQPTPSADGTWSNTIPVSNYCHDYEAYVNYNGSSSNTFLYSGIGSGYCPETAGVIWIQPQALAGWGPPGSLVVAGSASGAPTGTTVKMFWRDVTSNTSWNAVDFMAPVGSNGKWSNSIPNVDYSHSYEVYVKYDVFTSKPCRYNGNNQLNSCN